MKITEDYWDTKPVLLIRKPFIIFPSSWPKKVELKIENLRQDQVFGSMALGENCCLMSLVYPVWLCLRYREEDQACLDSHMGPQSQDRVDHTWQKMVFMFRINPASMRVLQHWQKHSIQFNWDHFFLTFKAQVAEKHISAAIPLYTIKQYSFLGGLSHRYMKPAASSLLIYALQFGRWFFLPFQSWS